MKIELKDVDTAELEHFLQNMEGELQLPPETIDRAVNAGLRGCGDPRRCEHDYANVLILRE